MLWIGLSSGTSADAVDAALVRFGASPRELELLAYTETPLDASLRKRIHEVSQGEISARELVRLDVELGARLAEAALSVAQKAGVRPADVEGIGSHGQTVGHFPESEVGGTLQLGAPSVLHEQTRIPVIADFRMADLAAGGQGAPLTPFFHQIRFAAAGEARAVLNIGGFTNVSWLSGDDSQPVVAFDPGPGNALIDRAARWSSNGAESFDRDGRGAGRGHVIPEALRALLDDPYFASPPPKSTGHEHFGEACFETARADVEARGGTPDDLLATLSALTVESIALAAERFFPAPADRWIVYGGGAQNPVLLSALRKRLAPVRVELSDDHGLRGDAVEAVTFAVLGWCAARGQPCNLPEATGASRAVVLGAATPPGCFRS